LIVTWMSNIKEVHDKPRLSTYYLECGRHVARLHHHRRCRCRHCAYAPTSNTTIHDNHEKINSWVSFSFLYEYGALFGGPLGRRRSTIIQLIGKYSTHLTLALLSHLLAGQTWNKSTVNKKHKVPL